MEKKLLLSGTTREEFWPTAHASHEVTFALDLEGEGRPAVLRYDPEVYRTGREEWKATFGRNWLTGTADWLDLDRPWVDDLKTGAFPPNPAESRQLRSYALVPWVADGCRMDFRCELTITHWPKYRLHAKPTRTRAWVTGFEMLDHFEELRWAATHDDVNPTDEGCKYCPARPSCPAHITEQG